MINSAQTVLRWFRDRWNLASGTWRLVYVLSILVLFGVLFRLTPFAYSFSSLFSIADPAAQANILLFLLFGWSVLILFGWERARRVDELKDAKAQADARREAAEQEIQQLQERWSHLLDVECRAMLWKREPVVPPPPFVPRLSRTTRFLTILNLKGGVGKTSLTGNLAVCLAQNTNPLRTLLIDIDFQGTLSDNTVDGTAIQLQHQNASSVNLLLTTTAADPQLVHRLAVSMKEVKACKVIIANDSLDAIEFELQARFFIDPRQDPRFRFRTHLHQPKVFENFDVVIFDCPPRVTTSVVNAVVCSDYVLIPTKLDDGSIDAVPRTVAWLKSLGSHCQAEIGVVASHAAVRLENLVRADRDSFEKLRGKVESCCGTGALFEAFVPSSRDALPPQRGQVAATTEAGRELYAKVAAELRKRLKI